MILKDWGTSIKLKKTFFIAFIVTYILIGYLSAMVVGIKWDESASVLSKFYVRTKMALSDGYLIKIPIALACAAVTTFLSNEKSKA
jgi:hypothetical protein